MKRVVKDSDIGVVVAANFSLGVNIFQNIVEKASACFAKQEDFSAWIKETHHAAKKDAPSGTALAIEKRMKDSGYKTPIAISSTRVGSVPGTHSVGFDGQFETITLTHTARNRATFARGALEAARWLYGKQGWFTMQDVLDID
jgi:4-hydroxy-tetrahydrodipicolinate reductase